MKYDYIEEDDGYGEGDRRRDVAREIDRRIRRYLGKLDPDTLEDFLDDENEWETFEPIKRKRQRR